jgi:hypothetical protein
MLAAEGEAVDDIRAGRAALAATSTEAKNRKRAHPISRMRPLSLAG